MGIFKKSIAVVLSVLMLVSVFSVAAFAEDGATVVRGTLPNCSWGEETDAANTMALADGVYSITYDTVAAGTYQFKVVSNGEWFGTGDDGNQNFAIVVSKDSDLTITFNADTKEVKFSGTNVAAQAGLDIQSISVAGTIPGLSWDTAGTPKMTKVADGVYELTLKNVEAGDYQYKFLVNESWDANWGADATDKEALEGAPVFNNSTNCALYFEGENKDVKITLDITKFDFATKAGATYKVELTDVVEETTLPEVEETTLPEETTIPQEYTSTPVEDETTTAAEEETTTAPVDPATPVEQETTAPVTEPVDPATPVEQETTTPATPSEEETTGPVEKPVVPGFYLVGSEEVCGAEWGHETPWLYGVPMTQASDGTFFQVFDNIKASAGNETDEGPDIYVFKVVYVDAKGNRTWHPAGMGNNTKVTVAENGSTILFQFKLLAARPTTEGDDPEAVIATVYGPNDEKPSFDDPKYPEVEPTTAEPTTEAPTVEPTTAAPTVEPTTAAPTVEPTTVAPTTAPKKDTPSKKTTKKTTKKPNTVKVKVKKKTVTVKAKSLKKKAFSVKLSKLFKVSKAKGKVTYAKVQKGTTKKIFKKVSIKKGKLVIKKGKLAKSKKGYKVKIKIKAKGTTKYKAKTITKVIKVKVK